MQSEIRNILKRNLQLSLQKQERNETLFSSANAMSVDSFMNKQERMLRRAYRVKRGK